MSHLPLHSFRLRQPHTGNQVLILSPPEAAGSQQSTEVQELEYLDDSSNWQCGVLLHKSIGFLIVQMIPTFLPRLP